MNNDQSDAQKIKNTSVFSLMTGISRLLGLARDMLKAYAFGTGIFAVAFDIAFRIPNMLRNLVAEGALSHSFIPVYDRYKKEGVKEATQASGIVVTLLFFFLLILSGIIIGTIPFWIPWLISEPSEKLIHLTVTLGRILFPYLLFISIASVYMGIQYSENAFKGPGFGPALMNLIILIFFGFYVFFFSMGKETVFVFSGIVLFSSIVNLLFQMILVQKMKRSPSFYAFFQIKKAWHHPVRKEITFMMIPAIFGAAVQEISQLIDIFLAMKVHEEVPGGVSALAYSHRLIQLPVGIFGVAVATASLTQLSSLFNDHKIKEFSNALLSSINMILYLLLPASIGLIMVSEEIVRVIFMRGSFDLYSVQITAQAVRYYAIGITGYSIQKIFMSSFYAARSPSVPARITFIVLIVNVFLSILFLPYLYHSGLALGSSLAGFFGVFIYLFLALKNKIILLNKKNFFEWGKIILLNAGLVGFISLTNLWLPYKNTAIKLLVLISVSLLYYVVFSYALKLKEFSQFYSMFKKRLLGNNLKKND